MRKIFTFIFIGFVTMSFAQSANDLFEQANAEYKEGNYQKAIEQYQKANSLGKQSAEVYFNLGNAYYKLNKIAPSVYYYEKAQLLNPNDEDINYNLQLAHQLKMDKIDKVPENILLRFKKKTTRLFSYNTWAYLTIFWAFLGVFVFGVFLFSKNPGYKRLAFVGMFAALFLLLFSWYNANYAKQLINEKYAIVFSPEATLMTEPNLSSDKILSLHEGAKVKVIKTDDQWKEVKLPNGKKGWLPQDVIKVIE